MFTTLNKIREQGPCTDGWELLLRHLGKTKADDEPLSLLTVLDSNGLDDTLWCFRAVDGFEKEMGLYAAKCVRSVAQLTTDSTLLAVLDVVERFAIGEASRAELEAAWDVAEVARAVSRVTEAARAVSRVTEAAWVARDAARVAWAVARAARSAALSASVVSQEAQLRKLLEETSNVSPVRPI